MPQLNTNNQNARKSGMSIPKKETPKKATWKPLSAKQKEEFKKMEIKVCAPFKRRRLQLTKMVARTGAIVWKHGWWKGEKFHKIQYTRQKPFTYVGGP